MADGSNITAIQAPIYLTAWRDRAGNLVFDEAVIANATRPEWALDQREDAEVVYRLNPDGTWADVTEEVARYMAEWAIKEGYYEHDGDFGYRATIPVPVFVQDHLSDELADMARDDRRTCGGAFARSDLVEHGTWG